MDPENIISALVAGTIIGLIARILVPSMQPIGCIMTILLGIVGAFAGILVGNAMGFGPADPESYSFWLVLLVQIVIAVLLVAITAAIFRKGSSSA